MSTTYRRLLAAGAATLVLFATPSGAAADPGALIRYPGERLILNGTAAETGGKLSLTATGPAGSAWAATRVDVSRSFLSSFEMELGSGDGIAFVVQTDGRTALGTAAGGLGLRRVAPSVAVEFDTARDPWDRDDNHVAVVTGGAVLDPKVVARAPVPLTGGPVRATVGYDADAGTLRVWIGVPSGETTRVLDTEIDIAATVGRRHAYAGFTGSGEMNTTQVVHRWVLTGRG